jgi:hypothetical protein
MSDSVLGELGISPDVSDDMEEDGDGGAGSSSWKDVDTGVLRSQEAIPVRRRFDGGMLAPAADGEKPCLESSRSDMSSEATEERGEPGDSAIGDFGGERDGSWVK